MPTTTRPQRPPCPACGQPLHRERRDESERMAYAGRGLARYRCRGTDCGWAGLLPVRRRGLFGKRVRALSRAAWPLALAAGMVAASATWWSTRHTVATQAVLVGRHVVMPGAHLEGDRLPQPHPLRALLPEQAHEVEPEAYTETADASLRVRRQCAWGLPGRNPYRGSIEQALHTAQLPAAVIRTMAADIRAGRRADQVEIRNAAIRAETSGREFDPRHVAMTYGMTMCVDTRVNFKPGHVEKGDLFEAMDEDGRVYAVMVPEVCGNVSVLGQRAERAPDGSLRRPPTPLATLASMHPDKRPRELPSALLFVDPDDPEDSDGGGGGEVPLPATLWLAGLALALMAASRPLRR